jgi:site-specific DNA recombinase
MRVFGYCRVSTADQANEGVSLEAQRSRILAWAKERGHAVEEADIFVDAGLSGKRADNRPALQTALNSVCKAAGVLVVYSLSRLARSTQDTLAISTRLEKSGADLVSLSEQLDTTTASGKMLFRLLAVLAEFERDLISERTKTALHHKRTKGERIGQIPFGSRLDDAGQTLVADPSEVETIATMSRLSNEGKSPRFIARHLNREGVPTKNGGAHWCHSSVSKILKREALNA